MSVNSPKIDVQIRRKTMSRLASGKRTPNANSLVHPELFNKGKLTPRRCKTRGEKKRILDLKTFEKKLTICDIDRAEITDESFERDLQKHEEFNDSVNKISFPFAIQTQSERCHTPFSDIGRIHNYIFCRKSRYHYRNKASWCWRRERKW